MSPAKREEKLATAHSELRETGGNFLEKYDISTKLRITSPFLCFVVLTRDCIVLFLDLLQTNSAGTLFASAE